MVLTPCRDATDAEVPLGAARVAKKAAGAGWSVRVTYADAEIDERRIESVLA